MGSSIVSSLSFLLFFFFFYFLCKSTVQGSALVPALYVFGDSFVDVGNNNYLNVAARADFPHNGIDFPGGKPTGRFSNGKVTPDYLAEKVSLPSPPPYLSLVLGNGTGVNKTPFTTGINFASGGSEIVEKTNDMHNEDENRALSMNRQIELYSSVYESLVEELGGSAAQARLSKSLFLIVIGSNDIFGYYYFVDRQNKPTPEKLVNSMITTFELQLKRLHSLGARKYGISGLGPLGCVPYHRRSDRINGECKDEMNYWAEKYNGALKAVLQRLETELKDFSYSYADTYAIVSEMIRTPSSYGFTEVKAACCGIGRLNAVIPCVPFASLCENRSSCLFWDLFHPSQEVDRIIMDDIFDDPSQYTYPFNIKDLIAI